MQTQDIQLKIIPIGNSQGVILPKEFMEGLHAKIGQTIPANLSDQGVLLKNTQNKYEKSSITEEFLTVLKRVNKQYKVALKALAEK